MTVTVYSKSGCVQCDATRKTLMRKHIDFQVRDLDSDLSAVDEVVALGYRQAPVVVSGAEHWSGFRPDKIAALIERIDDDSEVDGGA